jgi:hypothetical protein
LGRITVEVNGSWDAWYERTAELARSSERCDIYFQAVNPTNRSALMNIDWIRLDP